MNSAQLATTLAKGVSQNVAEFAGLKEMAL